MEASRESLLSATMPKAVRSEAKSLEEPENDGAEQDDGAGPLDEGPAALPGSAKDVATGGDMISGQLHDKGSGLTGEGLKLLQHDAGDNDRCHTDEVGGGSDPRGAAEQGSGKQSRQ